MLTSSPSPTLSAPSSPTSFHQRSYHATYRAANSTHSPRFPPQPAAARRLPLDAPAAPAHSPALSFARSPQQPPRREYANASTQYTPPGLPPTARPTRIRTEPEPSPSLGLGTKRREASAEIIASGPPEPNLRVNPEPPKPLDVARSSQAGAAGGGTQQRAQQVASAATAASSSAAEESQQQPSSAKRARNMDPGLKVMPLKYETCDVKDLGVLISDMLMELVRLNDGIPLQDGQLTRFHSRAPPGISVRDYLNRLIVHATLPPPILLSMVYYVDKLCALYPAFTISSLTVHRFLITAATVAAKGLSDSFWTNSLYARVGGVSVRELALLELEFLRRLDWKIVPKPEVLVDYYKGLVERGEGYTMDREPEPAQQVQETAAQEAASMQSGSSSSGDVFMEPTPTPAPETRNTR
ncbi:cyclin-domain-containing protein [Mytilinidion resinicola]|uniref:Cyclin-domain-containing protein n=1 Tax=Mytilinidion resinicola TaxID=574789 RepID=A0A6A6YSA5_9PEZI|nr:cyclin-domain-containing protein [Mytilinidion resinicola]KAF2811661.1 cyclin-domain-containing protein [Mytilinidion resinicola]